MTRSIFYLLAAIVLWAASNPALAQSRPVTVVELYTSQGCSSCPPADAYLGELAMRDDIVALSLHVDYWDYIGWKDPFAMAINTKRQRDYARHLGMGYIYTPQMVVQGMAHTTGADRGAVVDLIDDIQGAKRLDVSLSHNENGLAVHVPGGVFADERARILVAAFDARHETEIRRGENAGKILAYHNVVRDLAHVGKWNGEAVSLTINSDQVDMAGRDGCAVLVQSTKTGRILGAATISLKPAS